MDNNVTTAAKRMAGCVCLALGLSAVGLFGAAMANANSGHDSNADVASTTPPQMKLAASADQQIRTSGTQGTFTNAVQCTDTSSAKVDCVTPSMASAPQHPAK